ncbi:hypothetical protein FCN74_06040 [Mesohalobacter halotolerans]|uniref:Uncharacterized protein n=1 Tax=Mesohalobacter halotolerans TaxID=1883405 RepID=A0A4U5TT04_9FLAO|nr:hypothetical protein FCN74_06040 [Mesohalobacter halotolerans]
MILNIKRLTKILSHGYGLFDLFKPSISFILQSYFFRLFSTSILFIIGGYILLKNPLKEINWLYGYRTKISINNHLKTLPVTFLRVAAILNL